MGCSYKKKGTNVVNEFKKLLDNLKRKPNKRWVDKGSEFYNRSLKSWLEKSYRNAFSA